MPIPIFHHDKYRHPPRRESASRHDQQQTQQRVEVSSLNEMAGDESHDIDGPDHSLSGLFLPDQRIMRPFHPRQSPPRKPLHESPASPPDPADETFLSAQKLAQSPAHGNASSPATCTDRNDLIDRLKKGRKPTWVPNRYQFDLEWDQQPPPFTTHSPGRSSATSPSLLPPPTITPEEERTVPDDERNLQAGMQIERPPSALHTGDFTQNVTSLEEEGLSAHRTPVRSRQNINDIPSSWLATSPPLHLTSLNFERREPVSERSDEVRSALSSLSSSLSTSLAYKPPTSPLCHSESNDDVDLISPVNLSYDHPRKHRRHTLLTSLPGSYGCSPSPIQGQSPSLRHERTFPYQALQPRRSLGAAPGFSIQGSSPNTPAFLHSRRPSFTSDVTPLQQTSMVGSYEESILRGRMSTTPSKPLDFVAQIGVLGLGKCKSSLRCPPHVTLPFPAVFYSYGTSAHGRSKEDDGPSPYVGQIDLENNLPNQSDEARSKRKHQARAVERKAADPDGMAIGRTDASASNWDAQQAQKAKRSSALPRAPPGGSYRIPEKGQIQIIIKNPHKTAVKLFLVPYDLAGMEPGTKTFVRQRSYSKGPIIDNMPDSKGNPSADRPILRYLVHLHICCLSHSRYYLYKNIRVVFANRVPDGKERLQNEVTLPEPRFTPYKPVRVMHPPSSSGTGPGANLAAETAWRRRSAGFFSSGPDRAFDVADPFASSSSSSRPFPYGLANKLLPLDPIQSDFVANSIKKPTAEGHGATGSHDSPSRRSSQASQAYSNLPGRDGYNDESDKYNKLNKGDLGYGGNAYSGLYGSPAAAESLLSQRLRSLGVEKPNPDGSTEPS
ncbi:hypothetical protein F4808DRAFT_442182 [Astrocystis sublimbata]|nr:hypothetical protein F4808DRAFT_442182 [Astrocystis sublimbata]